MVEEKRSIEKFMKWLVDERWDLSNPVPIRTLYTEFFENNGNEKPYERNTYNCIKAKLNGKNILEKFTIPQLAHIVFLLSIPVDKKMKTLMETCGKLILDPHGGRINFFKSIDGKVWSGTHRQWKGKSKQVGNEEEEMPQVEEDDEAQRLQEALEEKFSRQHEIEVAEMSERNRIQDQMNDYVHNWNNFMEIEVRQEVPVASPQNAPAPRQQSTSTSTAPVNAQTTAPAINGAQFFKALKKVAYICKLDNVLKEIEKNEAKVENQNLSVPTMKIVMRMTCILNNIQNFVSKYEQPSGPQIKAELYLTSLNSAVLTLGSMEPVVEMIDDTMKSVRQKYMNISADKIREDFRALLNVASSAV